jgi:transposase
MEIAALARIERDGDCFTVPSVTNPRNTRYKVKVTPAASFCTCADHETRGCKCKHIYAIEAYLKRETTHHADGSTTVTESVTIKQTQKTYPQDWPNYNAAQVNEKKHFQELLHDLCDGIEQPGDDKPRRGRPRVQLRDVVYGIVYKIYSTRSGRRFSCDLADSRDNGFVDSAPHYNTCFKYIEKAELYPVLMSLIERASLPLAAVESQFAVDSTGFAYSRFVRWYDIKYNRFTSEQQWIKAHLACGVKTNVITAVEIHGRDAADQSQLPTLVGSTAKNFTMREVSADKAYSDRKCFDAIHKAGAEPYNMFKANTTGGVGGLFQKAFHYLQFKREEFLDHYHQRSNIESTIMMVKTKFGDSVRSKSEIAAKNEVLCKILCHNICCLISAMYELDLEPMLGGKASSASVDIIG